MTKASLFGGTLFSAGLAIGGVAQPASADFTFTNGAMNYGYSFGTNADGSYFFAFSYTFGPSFFPPLAYSADGIEMTAHANPQSMGFTHDRDIADELWTYTTASAFAYFGVTEDTTVQLTWDLGAWNQEDSWVWILDFSGGGADFFQAGGAGSATVDLTAGDEYWFLGISRGAAGGGHSFVTMTPAKPGVLGDLDGDGSVGTGDLILLLGEWGKCRGCDDCLADLDENCIVGSGDLILLLGNWG